MSRVKLFVELEKPLLTMVDFLLDGYMTQLASMAPGTRQKNLQEEFAQIRYGYLKLLRGKIPRGCKLRTRPLFEMMK